MSDERGEVGGEEGNSLCSMSCMLPIEPPEKIEEKRLFAFTLDPCDDEPDF